METLMGWMVACAMGASSIAAHQPLKLDTSPQAAAKRASEKGKLFMMVHVSGEFDDPGLT